MNEAVSGQACWGRAGTSLHLAGLAPVRPSDDIPNQDKRSVGNIRRPSLLRSGTLLALLSRFSSPAQVSLTFRNARSVGFRQWVIQLSGKRKWKRHPYHRSHTIDHLHNLQQTCMRICSLYSPSVPYLLFSVPDIAERTPPFQTFRYSRGLQVAVSQQEK